MINIPRTLMEKVGNMQELMSNISSEKEGKNQKEMLEIKH